MPGWDWGAFQRYLFNRFLLEGVWTTVWLSVVVMALGLLIGLLAALMNLSRHPVLRTAARFYLWLIRGTPLLIQLIIIYTGLPQIGIRFNVVQSALIGMTLNEGAYLSEIIRAGILSVPRGQYDAARALGMTYPVLMRVVVMPQAARVIIPPLGNNFNGLLKTTSLVSVISMEELLRRSQMLIQLEFRVLEIFLVAALYYLTLTTLWGVAQRRLEAHFGRSVAAAPEGLEPRRALTAEGEPVRAGGAAADRSLLEQDLR
ncbi:MAG: amino acid ABC transporter permease [Armatimonadota bacterium]|nr:amino acid ABC transporter permease [Armatimonadota bacterium]